MTTAKPCCRRSFTLVEMLVVIAIIGVLAAILVPTLYRVVIKARQNVIAQELNQLHLAIESYKQKFGDYPPDFTTIGAPGNLPELLTRHLRKAFPRHSDSFTNTNMTFPTGLPATWDHDNNPSTPEIPCDPSKLDPSEALVFWLGMLKSDPRQPLNGNAQNEKVFPFDETRLIDVDNDGWLSYVPPSGKEMPYVYFDSRIYTDPSPIPGVSPNTPVASLSVLKDASGNAVLYPYATKVNASVPLTMANKTTYQLISAGLDGDYGDVSAITAGDASTYKVFPFGLNFKIGDMDNIANFSDGKIFEDHME